MYYYEILPKDPSYFSEKLLTYHSDSKIKKLTIVKIALRSKINLGVVIKITTKPKYKTNPVIEIFDFIPSLPDETIKLMNWIHAYYPGPVGAVLQQLIPANVSNLNQNTYVNNTTLTSDSTFNTYVLPTFSSDQKAAIDKMKDVGPYLLHGDTGTGKTRLYIELALRCLNNKKSVLILTPEISLTPQLSTEFKNIFGDRVIITHSKITPKQKLENWLKILTDTDGLVVLGPRSALFSPFHKLGLVVVDESHETSYKQEQSPHYHANRVASKLASLYSAMYVMGSATPDVTDYYLAKNRNIPIIRMNMLAVKTNNTAITKTVVDLKDQSLFTRSRMLSDELIRSIEKSMLNDEQSLLFLNRRGTSRIIFCENCGWQSLCPKCDVPLIYHGDIHQARCHTCGHKEAPQNSCPSCGQAKILYRGFGTKALIEEVCKIFPQAKVKRFDTDNSKKESFEQNYYSVKSGETDIIVGTQTLIKGLDLPKLSTVGVIVAESALSFPDYTASEKTYQQINQVLGRIGRGHRHGTAIIQTYNPNNQTIKDSVDLNYEDFYENEIKERETYDYPPFSQILKLACLRSTDKAAENAANKLISQIGNLKLKVGIAGPAPSFHAKIDHKFQYQIIVRSKLRSELIKVIKILPSGWTYDIDPINLL